MNNQPAIDQILNRLKDLPDIPIVHRENILLIEPKNEKGFRVLLEDNSEQFTVFCDLWSYDQLFHYEDAAKFFLFALTAAARLLVKERNQKRYWLLLESCIEGIWGGLEITFLPKYYSIWKQKKLYYLQNDWVDIENLKPWIDKNFSSKKQGIDYCGICGQNLNPKYKFCPNCGDKLIG